MHALLVVLAVAGVAVRLEEEPRMWPSMRVFSTWFLQENAKRMGVQMIGDVQPGKNRIQYEVVKVGTGKTSPTRSQTVTLRYRDWYPAPTAAGVDVFESFGPLHTDSYSKIKLNAPKTIATSCDKLIRDGEHGLCQAIQHMKQGDGWRVYIPDTFAAARDGKLRVYSLFLSKVHETPTAVRQSS
jgi:hypothetical protein